MTKDKDKQSILIFIAVMCLSLIILFSISQIKPIYVVNDEIAVKTLDNISLTTLTYQEYQIKEGNGYVTDYNFVLAVDGTYYIAGLTQNNSIYMTERQIIGSSDGIIDITIQLYENSNFDDGIGLNNTNKNRNMIDNSTFKIYHNITLTDIGDKLPFDSFLYGDRKIKTSANNFISYNMKSNTTYMLLITNNGLKEVSLTTVWNWIES